MDYSEARELDAITDPYLGTIAGFGGVTGSQAVGFREEHDRIITVGFQKPTCLKPATQIYLKRDRIADSYQIVGDGLLSQEKYQELLSGGYLQVDFVSWDNVAVRTVSQNFQCPGIHNLFSAWIAIPPPLPNGFRMSVHPSWEKARARILEGYQDATFAELDLMSANLNLLENLTGPWSSGDFNPLYDKRPDWVEYEAKRR